MWALTRIKVLERYSDKQSSNFDMKLFAEYTSGFWIFKKTITIEMYRSNPIWDLIGKRQHVATTGSPFGFLYILENGDYVHPQFTKEIDEHFKFMYNKRSIRRRQIDRAKSVKAIK